MTYLKKQISLALVLLAVVPGAVVGVMTPQLDGIWQYFPSWPGCSSLV